MVIQGTPCTLVDVMKAIRQNNLCGGYGGHGRIQGAGWRVFGPGKDLLPDLAAIRLGVRPPTSITRSSVAAQTLSLP